jgi:hypothetical protein
MDAQAIADEIERRELIASIQGGATPTEPNPQPTSALENIQGLAQVERPTVGQTATAAVRGLPLANEMGSAAAAIPASFGSGESLGATYGDILGSEQAKEAEFAEAQPGMDALAQGAGEAFALAAPVTGLTGALAQKGAKALGKVKSGVQGLRGAKAAAAKPHFTGAQVAAGKHLGTKPKGWIRSAGEGAAEGAALDAVLGEDLDVMQGAKAGASLGSLRKFLTDTPAGKSMWLKIVRKMGGGPLTEAAWQAQNPRNQVVFKELYDALKRRAK